MAEKKSLLNKVIDAVTDRDEKAAAAAAAKAKAQAAVNARAIAAVAKAQVQVKAKAAQIAEAKEAEIKLVKHVVQQGETWTHLALKYYGRSIEPFWRFIFEYPANKALVGGDYKKLKAGMELVIPELSEELKNMPVIKPSK